MLDLSTPSDTSERVAGRRELRVLVVAIPVVVALALAWVVVVDRAPASQLLVMVPAVGTIGRPLPIRAVLVEWDADAPPELSPSVVMEARLVDPSSSAIVARASLRPSASLGAEGSIGLPPRLPDPVLLEVAAMRRGGRTIVHRRRLPTASDAPPAPTRARPRAGPSALLASPVRPAEGALPPDRLKLRACGGACVPELPCRLLVELGRPAARLDLELLRGAGRIERVGSDPGETEGLVEWEARLASADAAVELVARRGDVEVARREVQLPVELGAPAVRVERALWNAPAHPSFAVYALDPHRAFVVDLLRDERWEQAFSIPAPEPAPAMGEPIHARVPEPLEPGLYRVEVRASPFDRASVASDLFFVGAPGASPAELRAALERRLAARVASEEPPRNGESDPEAAARFLLAPVAAERVEAPSFRASTDRSDREAWTLRISMAAVILALGLVAATILLVRGREAEREAQDLLVEAEAPPEEVASSARRSRRTTVGAALFVVAVFGVVAWIVLSRGCL